MEEQERVSINYDKKVDTNEIQFLASWNNTPNGNQATTGQDANKNSYGAVLYQNNDGQYQILINGTLPGSIVKSKLMTLKEVVPEDGAEWRTSGTGAIHKYFRGSRLITRDGKEFLEQYSGNLFQDSSKLLVTVSESPVEDADEASNTAKNIDI